MNKTLRKAKVHEPQNKKMTILLIPFIICCIGAFICLAALVLSACFEAYDSMALSAALFTFFMHWDIISVTLVSTHYKCLNSYIYYLSFYSE